MHLDTLLGRARGPILRRARDVGLMLIPAALGACSLVVLFSLFGTDLGAARRACDRAVEALLTSRDPVELQRSGILIHELDCSISRRLPKKP